MLAQETAVAIKSVSALRASSIEGVYTGLEGVLKEVLSVVDDGVSSAGDSWHARLIAQAADANSQSGRSAIITADVYAALDRLRAFRHIERNVYRHLLRHESVRENFDLMKGVFPTFIQQVEEFIEGYRFDERQNDIPNESAAGEIDRPVAVEPTTEIDQNADEASDDVAPRKP
jgi:pyruvate kinase